MQTWPEDVVHIIISVLSQDLNKEHGSSAVEWQTISAVGSCCRVLKNIAQPVLYKTVAVQNVTRAETLYKLLRHSPSLVAATESLIIGDSRRRSPIVIYSENQRYFDNYLNQSDLAPLLFEHFTALSILQLSQINVNLAGIFGCLHKINNIRELRVDRCMFWGRSRLTLLLQTLPNLETFTLDGNFLDDVHCSIVLLPPVVLEYLEHPTHEFTIQSLRSLSIRSIADEDPLPIEYTDATSFACDNLIRSGRLSSLVDLSFDVSDRSRVTALGLLVCHASQTLTSLALQSPTHGNHIPIPNFGSLPRLRLIRICNVDVWYQVAADLLLALVARVEGKPRVELEIPAWSGRDLLIPRAAPIWQCVDTVAYRAQISIGIRQYLSMDNHWQPVNEADIRDIIPRASAGEDFALIITHVVK